jgi:hypothetical protein
MSCTEFELDQIEKATVMCHKKDAEQRSGDGPRQRVGKGERGFREQRVQRRAKPAKPGQGQRFPPHWRWRQSAWGVAIAGG